MRVQENLETRLSARAVIAEPPQPREPAPAEKSWMVDRFEVSDSRPAPVRLDVPSGTGESPPPPLEGRQPADWQKYCEQFRGPAKDALDWKANSVIPDKQLETLLHQGGGPIYVGAWSKNAGHEDTPVFFQNFPSDKDVQAQLYCYRDEKSQKWMAFEVAGDFQKAYGDPTYTSGRLGTSSQLGFPVSGTEFAPAGKEAFTQDPEVANAIASSPDHRVKFQNFENGFMVDVGGGRIQAFDQAGKRIGSSYPGGALNASSDPQPTTPMIGGVDPLAKYRSNYQAYEVVPGISVPSRLGIHWGPEAGYSNTQRIDQAADMLKDRGIGYATVVVNPGNVDAQAATLKALKDRGIEPVVRMLPAGQYGRPTMDELNDGQLRELATAAKKLKEDYGVRVIQLDNEPNSVGPEMMTRINEPGHEQEFKDTVSRYAANTATAMKYINEAAPGMAIGFGALNPMAQGWDKFHTQLMWEMKLQDSQAGGHLLDNAFLAVHPYTIGQYNDANHKGSQGVECSQWMRDNAREILGRNINTLATEGGNTRGNGINVTELDMLQKYPQGTQCFWILGDQFLKGPAADGKYPPPGDWEPDAMVTVDANGQTVMSKFWDNLYRVSHNQQPIVP